MRDLARRRRDILRHLLFASLLVAAPVSSAFAQIQRPVNQLFGGGSYIRTDDTTPVNAYGWALSYSQFPYDSRTWIGGTIQANGTYASPAVTVGNKTLNGLVSDTIYTFMGGPAFTMPRRRILPRFVPFTPFGHMLLGAVLANVNTTGKGLSVLGSSSSQSKTAFGYALGGGADHSLTHNLTLRGQADWLRTSFADENVSRQNNLQVSFGLVVKF